MASLKNNNNAQKNVEIIKKITSVLIIATLIISAVLLMLNSGGKSLTSEQQTALDKAYEEAAAAVTARGAQLEQWYLRQKEFTPAAASELTSLRSKWVMGKTMVTGNEEQRKQYVNAVIAKHLYSKEDCEQGTMHHAALLIKDWLDAEDTLSRKARCPSLSVEAREHELKGADMVTANINGELAQMLYAELGALVGGELASQVGIQLATSAGLIGAGTLGAAETFGISLGLGILADLVVSWIMDAEADITEKLNEQVEKEACEHRKLFEETMLKVLKQRKADWEEQISNSN